MRSIHVLVIAAASGASVLLAAPPVSADTPVPAPLVSAAAPVLAPLASAAAPFLAPLMSAAGPAVSAAAPILAPVPAAAPVLAPHERNVTLPSGAVITVGQKDESAVPLSNLSTIREISVSNTAYARADGPPIAGGVLKTGYRIGCAMDVSALTPSITANAGITPSVIIEPGDHGNPKFSTNIGPTAGVTPGVYVELGPGQMADVSMGDKDLAGPVASITNSQVLIQVDKCMAPATVRSYTIFAAKTPAADETIAVYGDPITL